MHATNGYAGLSQLKKQKLEAAGSTGAVQALGMENDAPVVGPETITLFGVLLKSARGLPKGMLDAPIRN